MEKSFLETTPIPKLMRKYAVPCVVSLLVAALYNIVDQIFIANASYLGSNGNAANTVVFPLTVIALAVAVMIGDGCCTFVSLSLGRKQTEDASGGIGSAYQRILLNELSVAELDAAISEYRIPAQLSRCVLLLHMIQVQGRSARDILSEVIPMSPNDVLIAMDNHTAALIKCTAGMDELEDLKQFAAALQETVQEETGLPLTVGIGDIAQNAGELHQSYRQARRAIEIGRIYREDETIHVYSSLLLERFLADIPPETAAHYHSLLFNRRTSRLFSEEILYTVEMFFRKDLNLSDTARQLYIHRNTLVYRLDKVQRQIGLNLRSFDDAVTFKMLLEMKKCAANKAKKTL